MAENQKKFLIIDGNALVHRAYHALPPLKTKKGELVNAVYGFCLVLFKVLEELKPEFIAACFDLAEPTFRHKAFKQYKAQRKKAPDELYQQIDGIKKLLKAFAVPIFEKPGFEADDLIGALTQKAKNRGVENIVLTGDLDALQLVDEKTQVYTMRRGLKDTVLYDQEKVKEKYQGLGPEQLVDFKALRGDPSDNIPGVKGIGEKTAIDLLKGFSSLENLYSKIEQNGPEIKKIKKPVLEKLKKDKAQAFLSQKLAKIDCQVEIKFSLKDSAWDFDKARALKALEGFEFHSLAKKLALAGGDDPERASQSKAGPGQAALFSSKSSPEPNLANQPAVKKEIIQLEQQGVFSPQIGQLERALMPLVSRMSERGIRADQQCLAKLSQSFQNKLAQLEKKIFQEAKAKFNISSPQQLSEVLFEKLKIPSQTVKKTPTGALSTSASQLAKLKSAHPIISHIVDYRELFKLKTGFVDVLPKMISPADGRIHAQFHQLGTETGRMSCSAPNLQNIPIKSDLGREIRKCFLPDPGFVFLSADYSQIDLRVAASLADDKQMLQFFKEGKDIHKMTASALFKVKEDKVTKTQRKLAKTLNFGVLYGMGPHKFAENTGLSYQESQQFIEEYFVSFQGIAQFVEKTIAQARQKGFSQTLFGRKRFLPEINSRDQRLRAQAERIARNLPAQGTVADIMKKVMVYIAQKKILDKDCRLLLQIHDELLFEIKKDKLEPKAMAVKKIMEGVVKLKAPLIVDLKAGPNWGSLKNMLK